MKHGATQLPPWFWILTGFVLGYWAAYLLRAIVNFVPRPATHVTIRQFRGECMITGVLVGGSGKFQATFNGALQAGAIPSWTADPSVTISPAADGLTCDVVVPAGSTITAFGLAVAGIASDGAFVSTSVNVPVLTPPPAPATVVTIDQIA